MKLARVTAASAFMLVFAILALGVVGGFAGEGCLGHMAVASWYGPESGSRTATGDYFDGSSLTAAMPSRSHLGERWRVTYRGRSVTVLVNDLGPAAYLHRSIDLSRAAARAIGFDGVHQVCLERL